MKSESELESEQKLSERARRGMRRAVSGLLVAALMASGLACVSRASAEAVTGVGEAPVVSRGAERGGGEAGAGEGEVAGSPEGVGEHGEDDGDGASSGPLSEWTAAVSSANVQRLRDVARLD